MADRQTASIGFLNACGWGSANRQFLAGDASDRSYQRLTLEGRTAILMDAPPGRGDDPRDFVRIAKHLLELDLSAPRIMAEDFENGFLLIEDLGDGVFARLLDHDTQREQDLYVRATDVLLHLQAHPAPSGLMNLTRDDWADSAALSLDFYSAPTRPASTAERRDFVDCLSSLMGRFADGPRVLILRDFHAENLLLIPDRDGLSSVGLLDFQLAQMGQPLYDLVSLLQDARRDVQPATVDACLDRFARARGMEMSALDTAVATMGALRALRILGVFARLCSVAGKPGYLTMIPRVWRLLEGNLTHPRLSDLREICRNLLPEPTETHILKIRTTCPTPCP